MRISALCLLGILLNLGGFGITRVFDIPMFFDTLGTAIVAALAGYLPGIVVGFCTNLIKGILVSPERYYSLLNMLTAVCVAYFSSKGFYKKPLKALVTVPVIVIITAVPGAVLAWFLNDSAIGGVGKRLADFLSEKTALKGFGALLTADFITELADKALVIIILFIVLKLLPQHIKELFTGTSGWQAPLTEEMKDGIKKSKCRSVSLRTKILLILIIASLFIAGTATVISYMLFKNSTINEHIKMANGIAELAGASIDADRVDEYIEKGEAAQGYIDTENMLYRLRDSSPDVQYVYVYKIMEDGCHVVFDLDTDELEGSSPGDIIGFDEAFEPYLPALLAGDTIEPIISDESYGWLLTVYTPVYDSTGECRCYAAVDISMNLLSAYSYSFIAKLISLLLGFFILVLAIGLWVVNYNVILPVNTMAYCAGAFAYNSEEAIEDNVERIKQLGICTGDEIENLYLAFAKTTEDSMQYVADIQNKTETISQMQNGLIMVLADMVESRDKCTGDHVRKTAAYVEIITDEMQKKGFYADQLTDEFVQNVKNAAPLHDIGKIHVSDVILNKPGKLTDEEFEIMKSHTTLGSEIISRAIDMVPDSGYLEEAKNLSEYHHEKWNGKGYPHGISGEDIPLSARIMAVADVFDALVSRRSYKKPFPFEKAMSIIREDAGTHFDPLVAEAFLGAEDRVRQVAEDFEHMNTNTFTN